MSAQPTLPSEVPFTDAELAFFEDSPPGLFPDNQNSNFGFVIRKLFSDYIQALIGQQQTMYNERFVDTSTQFLDEWEHQEDLPQNPTSITLSQRRQAVLGRVRKGPFTWDRRAQVLDSFVTSSFGDPVKFTPSGIGFDASGIPLYAGVTTSIGAYRVYEDIRNYSYEVWLKSGFTPGAGFTRELQRITPAGITFTIDISHADVLDYYRTVRNAHPVGYWRLGSLSDASGGGAALTAVAGVTAGSVASPGLLVAPTDGSEGAATFDGVDDQFTVAPAAALQASPAISFETWVRLTAFAANSASRPIIAQANRYLSVFTDSTGVKKWRFSVMVDGVQQTLDVPTAIATGTTYHVVGVCDGTALQIYVNGALVGSQPVSSTQGALTIDSSTLRIGSDNTNFMNGVIDEAAVYNYALTPDVILDHYNTGRDIATY